MSKLLVALFINNRVYQYKIDEIIQNSSNGYIDKTLVRGNKKIYFPVQIVGEDYCLQNKSTYEIRYDNATVEGRHVLAHGDYFVFSKDETVYSALVLDYARLSLGSGAYALGADNVFIGRSEEMNIVIDVNANVSRKCAAIRMDEEGHHHIEDLSGKTGIYVNGQRESSKLLAMGDEIYIMGTTILYYPNMLILPSHVKTNLKGVTEFETLSCVQRDEENYYVRTPRIVKSKEQGAVVIDAPPNPQRAKEMPFILTVGPSLTMALAMLASVGVTISNAMNGGGMGSLVTSSVMAFSMLAGALLWPVLLRRYNKKQEIKNEKYRRAKYAAYLAEKETEIKQKYDRNIRVANENLLPSPASLAEIVTEQSRRLWERMPKDDDFLSVRLGIGEEEFSVEIQSPRKGFTLEDDPMLDEAVALRERYKTVSGVPISISLTEKKVIGVVGATMDVLKVVVANTVVLHAPDEVKLVLIYNAMDTKNMRWACDLPHVWSDDRKQRFVATNKEEAKALLSTLEEAVAGRDADRKEKETSVPTYVVLVLDEQLVEDMPFRRHLINPENQVGVSTVFFGKKFNNIPKECVAIIQKDADLCGIYVKNENNNRFISYEADTVDDTMMSEISTGINKVPIKAAKGTQGVPERITFLDMYRVGNVDALEITNHWKTNISEKSLAAPIGIKAGGEAFCLDIHEKLHGCHGLVAGTTGSGKSEFLQAYILSMMINYSPDEVAFVLVDFKGGDMARPFLKTPHLAATISNLSGNTLHRALISLEAEVKNRQNIFNKSAEKLNVDKIDINSYHKFFKDKKLSTPLPHLIIVIDEFAQLKSQHPEFMSKLVDIAQVGRSLGIHLILATQRPSGVIDPQIWSNAKFKVCLKVLDKQDSMDMINHPEAALIKQPGRAYVQVGYDEIFEQIQSGYSGADYIEQDDYIDEDSVSVDMINWPAEKIRTAKKLLADKKSERTQLEEVVSSIVSCGEAQNVRVKQLWLPPLPSALLLEKCNGYCESFDLEKWDSAPLGEIACGMADFPERQEQRSFALNFLKNGHLAIYGASGTGKSTLVQTILFAAASQYSPAVFNAVVLDFDGNSLASAAAMPHCAAYASGDDENAVEEIMRTLQAIIDERHEKFTQNHCANYESYVSSGGEPMPFVLVALDNYAAFREKMYRSEDMLVQIISAARSCGIYFIITGNSKGAVYYKVAEQVPCKIVLNMNDSGAYRDILNVPVPIMPEQTKGRALTVIDKCAVEVQFAVPFHTTEEVTRTRRIHDVYDEMRAKAEAVTYEYDLARDTVSAEEEGGHVPLRLSEMEVLEGLAVKTNALVIGTDLTTEEPKGFAVEGEKRFFIGTRGNAEVPSLLLGRFAANTQKKIYLFDGDNTISHETLDEKTVLVEDIDALVEILLSEDEEERRNTVLVINGFCEFFDRISDEALLVLERALTNGLEASVITLDAMQRLNDYRDTGLYIHLVRAENGAVVGGQADDAVAASLATGLYDVPQRYREKALGALEATVYSGTKIAYVNIERG